MKPDVNQHLQSMAKTLAEVVLPELKDKPFAQEQAGLIIASINLLVEVQEHQFAYAHREYVDTASLLRVWQEALPASGNASLWAEVSELSALPDAPGLRELSDKVLKLKSHLRTLMENHRASYGETLSGLLGTYIERQLARETSWLRATGFIPDAGAVPAIGSVLKQQAAAPLTA